MVHGYTTHSIIIYTYSRYCSLSLCNITFTLCFLKCTSCLKNISNEQSKSISKFFLKQKETKAFVATSLYATS